MEGIEIKFVLADVWVNTSSARDYAPDISFEESVEYAAAIGSVLPKAK